jgi:hypothetical protein
LRKSYLGQSHKNANSKKYVRPIALRKRFATTGRMFSELPAEDARHSIRFGTHAFLAQPWRPFPCVTLHAVRLYLNYTNILSHTFRYVKSFLKILSKSFHNFKFVSDKVNKKHTIMFLRMRKDIILCFSLIYSRWNRKRKSSTEFGVKQIKKCNADRSHRIIRTT